MPKLESQMSPGAESFQRTFTYNQGLANELRERIRVTALGGPEAARSRHVSRKKLLARDRVTRIVGPRSPVP